jgi:hypothetical protein
MLFAVVGLIMGAAFWWYRVKYLSDAASEAADVIGRVQGKIRRDKLRKKSASAPIETINDPLTAAATIMTAIATEDGVLSPDLEQSIRAQLENIESGPKLDEAMIYAKWASGQMAEVPMVIDIAGRYLATKLNEEEKLDLMQMIASAVPQDKRHEAFPDRLKRLRQKLGMALN